MLVWLFRYEKNEFDALFPKIRVAEFKKLPIPNVKPVQAKTIEQKVDQILILKKGNSLPDTSALEAEIDQLVYELYGLTEEEIKIIEEY